MEAWRKLDDAFRLLKPITFPDIIRDGRLKALAVDMEGCIDRSRRLKKIAFFDKMAPRGEEIVITGALVGLAVTLKNPGCFVGGMVGLTAVKLLESAAASSKVGFVHDVDELRDKIYDADLLVRKGGLVDSVNLRGQLIDRHFR